VASFDPKCKIEKVNEDWKEEVNEVIDEMQSQSEQDLQIGTVTMSSTLVVAGIFSAGYITWMLQSGALFASMLSSIPAWASFDPLPILESYTGGPEGSGPKNDEDKLEEKIQSMLD